MDRNGLDRPGRGSNPQLLAQGWARYASTAELRQKGHGEWTGLGSTGLDCIGLGWAGLRWTGAEGKAREGKARQGKARQGRAGQGKARQGKDKAKQGKGKARQGKARQGKARQGKARPGKARPGEARRGQGEGKPRARLGRIWAKLGWAELSGLGWAGLRCLNKCWPGLAGWAARRLSWLTELS